MPLIEEELCFLKKKVTIDDLNLQQQFYTTKYPEQPDDIIMHLSPATCVANANDKEAMSTAKRIGLLVTPPIIEG